MLKWLFLCPHLLNWCIFYISGLLIQILILSMMDFSRLKEERREDWLQRRLRLSLICCQNYIFIVKFQIRSLCHIRKWARSWANQWIPPTYSLLKLLVTSEILRLSDKKMSSPVRVQSPAVRLVKRRYSRAFILVDRLVICRYIFLFL